MSNFDYKQFTMVHPTHIPEIQQFVDIINKENIEGAIVECGVWKGGIIMACLNQQKKFNEDREFYLYDTFAGMTEPNSEFDLKKDKDEFVNKTHGIWHKIDLDQVKSNIKKISYDENKIHFIKGDVCETLKYGKLPDKIAILRLDTDWFESTKIELEQLYPLVVDKGFVIIDDYRNKDLYDNPRGARVACNFYFPGIKHEMQLIKPLTVENTYPFCFRKTKMNISIVSFSDKPDVYNISFPNLKYYCAVNKYTFFPFHENKEKHFKPHWNKLHYLIEMINSDNKSDYIVWFDHDIVIKNHKRKIEDIINEYKFSENVANFMMSKDPVSNFDFNSGVIIVKNNSNSKHVLNQLIHLRNNFVKMPDNKEYGGFDFNQGLQDTRVLKYYFDKQPKDLLSIPHKVLQSFHGYNNKFYKEGDFCIHFAGPQNEELINLMSKFTYT